MTETVQMVVLARHDPLSFLAAENSESAEIYSQNLSVISVVSAANIDQNLVSGVLTACRNIIDKFLPTSTRRVYNLMVNCLKTRLRADSN